MRGLFPETPRSRPRRMPSVSRSALSAKARRGALVVLTKVDGAEVKGELVSVRARSPSSPQKPRCPDHPPGRVHSVTIMRRSRMALGALTGFTAVVLAGVSWGISRRRFPRSRHPTLGPGWRLRRRIRADHRHGGQPRAEGRVRHPVRRTSRGPGADERLERQQALTAPVPRPSAAPPKPRPSAAAQATSQGARLRIALGPSFPFGSQEYRTSSASGSFRFLENVPLGESNPYAVSFSRGQVKQLRNVYFGPVSLAYDVTDRLAAEIELLVSGTANGVWTSGDLVFTSTADGLEYTATAGSDYETSFTSVLAGLVLPVEEADGAGPAHLRARHRGRTGFRPAGRAALDDRRSAPVARPPQDLPRCQGPGRLRFPHRTGVFRRRRRRLSLSPSRIRRFGLFDRFRFPGSRQRGEHAHPSDRGHSPCPPGRVVEPLLRLALRLQDLIPAAP